MPHRDQPPQVADVLLWRLARQVAAAHQPDPARPKRCGNLGCHATGWPCPAARLAQQAEHASRRGIPPRRIRRPPDHDRPGTGTSRCT